MLSFLVCGIALFLAAYIWFRKRIFYPSVVFCLMWGLNCIFHVLIYKDLVNPLVSVDEFSYQYMDAYIIYFTIATLVGFSFAHMISGSKGVKIMMSLSSLEFVLQKYKWLMWLNFWGGILRIVAMIQIVGFDFNNIIDYRLAANAVMMGGGSGWVGFVFRITAYIIMLANFYVAMSGLKGGLKSINIKETLTLFLLYMPSQMATGGRLFILYFVIFYFGSFLLGRGISIAYKKRQWLLATEKRAMINMAIIMVPLVVAISAVRSDGGIENLSGEKNLSALDAFTYICDGTMTTDKCMDFFGGENIGMSSYGKGTFSGQSERLSDFGYFKNGTKYASSVYTIIIPLYTDFGYRGSLIVWTMLAFLIELLALNCLSKLTFMKFLIFAILLKVCYESILSNPFAGNIPIFELLLLLAIFNRHIFGRYGLG